MFGRLTALAALSVVALAVQLTDASAQPAKKFVKDWVAVCQDNGDCAAAMYVDPGAEGYVARHFLRIGRIAKKTAKWTISISTVAVLADRDRPVEIRIDDNPPITLRPETGYAPFGAINDFFVVRRGPLKKLFKQIQDGRSLRFTFLDVSGGSHDIDFSLSGVSAALLWIDERQSRLNSPRVAAAPHHLQPAPRVDKGTAVARIGVPPHLLARHRAMSDCEDPNSEHMSNLKPVIGPVSGTAMLYAIPCSAGAYNVAYRLYIIESGEIGGIENLFFAGYTKEHGWSGTDLLFNVTFDPATKQLSSFYKGRGLGDCGNTGTWVWKRFAFAMTAFKSWSKCNGRRPENWPLVFPAK